MKELRIVAKCVAINGIDNSAVLEIGMTVGVGNFLRFDEIERLLKMPKWRIETLGDGHIYKTSPIGRSIYMGGPDLKIHRLDGYVLLYFDETGMITKSVCQYKEMLECLLLQ